MVLDFLEDKGFLLFDGAMGTQLQQMGLEPGELPEIYNITHPSKVLEVHRSYVKAGADIATSNTFQANPLKLEGSGYTVEDVVAAGVRLAKESGAAYAALGMGPTGSLIAPLGELSFEDVYELYRRQISAGRDADLILVETLSSLHEAKAAILAAKEHSSLPVYVTLTFQADGRTFLGTDPETAVITLQGLGVSGIGMNCSLGPKELIPLAERMLKYARVPLVIQPNAGLPEIRGGKTVYNVSPAEFGEYISVLAGMGVRIFGGCCGTTPEFISNIRRRLDSIEPVSVKPVAVSAATSATRLVILDNNVTVIGERINPTGKKRLKQALIGNDFEYIKSEALNQSEADILDINAGLPELDEAAALTAVVRQVNGLVNMPLQIDSSDPAALESAVRVYNGKPIVNSVNGKAESMEAVFPIIKKYGAAVVGLTLDEDGIPKTAAERLDIARKLLNTAQGYGIPKEDLIIDSLVLTASSEQAQVMETIKAIMLIKSELGLKTVLGVSNVSYGLPSRDILNSTFLAAALGAGLDAAILNPVSKIMMETVSAFRVLNGSDVNSAGFIARHSNTEAPAVRADRGLREIIAEGRVEEAPGKITELLAAMEPLEIVDSCIIPALDEAGEKYESGEIFLPQLLYSAQTVKAGFDVLRQYMPASEASKGKIILATVEGDIHDIGKNIVKVLLENYGYEVVDLGKDVPAERIAAAVKHHGAKLVGLSALMTTTVKSMKAAIDTLRSVSDCIVMVGGAVLNADYCQMLGADYYGRDAREAVKIADMVFTPQSGQSHTKAYCTKLGGAPPLQTSPQATS